MTTFDRRLAKVRLKCANCGNTFKQKAVWSGEESCPKCGSRDVEVDPEWLSDPGLVQVGGKMSEHWPRHGAEPAAPWKCQECGKTFKKRVGPNTVEIECPKCGSTDIEPDYGHKDDHVFFPRGSKSAAPLLDNSGYPDTQLLGNSEEDDIKRASNALSDYVSEAIESNAMDLADMYGQPSEFEEAMDVSARYESLLATKLIGNLRRNYVASKTADFGDYDEFGSHQDYLLDQIVTQIQEYGRQVGKSADEVLQDVSAVIGSTQWVDASKRKRASLTHGDNINEMVQGYAEEYPDDQQDIFEEAISVGCYGLADIGVTGIAAIAAEKAAQAEGSREAMTNKIAEIPPQFQEQIDKQRGKGGGGDGPKDDKPKGEDKPKDEGHKLPDISDLSEADLKKLKSEIDKKLDDSKKDDKPADDKPKDEAPKAESDAPDDEDDEDELPDFLKGGSTDRCGGTGFIVDAGEDSWGDLAVPLTLPCPDCNAGAQASSAVEAARRVVAVVGRGNEQGNFEPVTDIGEARLAASALSEGRLAVASAQGKPGTYLINGQAEAGKSLEGAVIGWPYRLDLVHG